MAKRNTSELRNWDVFLWNGEFFATLSYTRQMLKRAFPGARVKGSSVFLA